MHLRPATQLDLSRFADIQADCNTTDALARFFTRNIFEYYTSYRQGGLQFVKNLLLGPGCMGFVLETDPSDYPDSTSDDAPEVVGWAVWSRCGDSETAKKWQRSVNGGWGAALNRQLMGLEEKYRKVCRRDVTRIHENMDMMKQDIMAEEWDELLKECWELEGCFVDRRWQKRGLSKMLIDWGKERAREEGVPVVVHGSPVGGIAYRRNGFTSIGVAGFSKYFDELEYGGELMQNWVWVPEGVGMDDLPQRCKVRRDERLKAKEEAEAKKST